LGRETGQNGVSGIIEHLADRVGPYRIGQKQHDLETLKKIVRIIEFTARI